MKQRSIRRHHEQRIEHRVRSYYGGYAQGDPRVIGQLAHARTPCSGPCCGNPRRWWRTPTIQELRSISG